MTRTERDAAERCALATADTRRRPVALVQLIATVALALSTMIAVTAVSIGIARAEVFGVHADGDTTPLAIALLIGLMLSATAGLTAIMVDSPKAKTQVSRSGCRFS